jgi:hypothetical protein
VKQSASVLVSLLAMAAALAAPSFLYAVLKPRSFALFSVAVAVAVFAAAAIVWRAVMGVGRRLFDRILD